MDDKEYTEAMISNYNTFRTEAYASVNYRLMQEVGPLEALVFSVLFSKEHYHRVKKDLTEDGFFFETVDHMEQKINLSVYKQTTCIKTLIEANLLEMEVRGQDPPKRHFKIRHDVLNSVLKSIFKEIKNQVIPDTYEKDTEGSIIEEINNAKLKKSEQVTIKDNKNKPVISTPSVYNTNRSAVCTNTLHPRKTIKIRTTPLNLVPEDPYKNNHEGKTPIFVKKKKPKHLKETDEMLEILCYWESKEFKRSIPGEHTESYARLLLYIDSLLKGTLFEGFRDRGIIRKYSVREVKISIDNFTLAAFNNDYEPMSLSVKEYLQTLSLSDFLYNPRENDEHRKSKFLLYLGKPKLVADNPKFLVKDELPNITNRLEDWYKHTFHNSNGSFKRNDLIFASKALKKFYEDNKSKLYLEDYMSQYNLREPIAFLAKQLTRVFEKMLRENDGLYTIITTEWLKSAKTMEDRLPSFLRSEHMMK